MKGYNNEFLRNGIQYSIFVYCKSSTCTSRHRLKLSSVSGIGNFSHDIPANNSTCTPFGEYNIPWYVSFQPILFFDITHYLMFTFVFTFSTVIATNLLLVDEIMRAGMTSLKGWPPFYIYLYIFCTRTIFIYLNCVLWMCLSLYVKKDNLTTKIWNQTVFKTLLFEKQNFISIQQVFLISLTCQKHM